MRGDDAVDARRAWIVVKKYIAAAIDLDVNETGSEPAPAGQLIHRYAGWEVSTWAKPSDARPFDENCPMPLHDTAVEQRIDGHGMRWSGAHVVRVIFCRFRGLSTSISRRSARASIIA